MSKVLMVASEAAPFAKTGGLADVLGALPAALHALGEEVAVVLPRYQRIDLSRARRVWDRLPIRLGRRDFSVDLYAEDVQGVTYYFVEQPALFDRPGLYGENNVDYPDNATRFAVFCRAALGVVRYLFRPNVLHLHDWQAALTAPYIRENFAADPTYAACKLITTIHNLGYQGIFSPVQLDELGLSPALLTRGDLEFYGDVNLLKGAIVYSDRITTVSQTYAREIQTPEYGFGLDGLLRARSADVTGIVNGVDYSQWSPEHDPYLPAPFSALDLTGKQACKQALLAEFGLPLDLERPVIGIISRFAEQKGFDLIAAAADGIMQEDVSLVVLGSGAPEYENLFRQLAAAYPDRVGVRIGYDEALSHRIEGGADLFLLPSRYEPCGLNQIYSLRYGTLPIVRATGGLDDTIDEETGFKFRPYTGAALLQAIQAALTVYADQSRWTLMMERAMAKDYSWRASAGEYRQLYRSLSA